METNQTQANKKDFWDNMRETVRGGFVELRNKGDELARQGRLRMELYQFERRLRDTYTILGRESVELLGQAQSVTLDNPRIKELTDRVKYLKDEISRLRDELTKKPDAETVA